MSSVFDLTDHPAKADPALIANDEVHFAAVADSLERSIAELAERLETLAAHRAVPASVPWTATRRCTG